MEKKRKIVVAVESRPEYDVQAPVGPDREILAEQTRPAAAYPQDGVIAGDESVDRAASSGGAVSGGTPPYPVDPVVAPDEVMVRPGRVPQYDMDRESAPDEEMRRAIVPPKYGEAPAPAPDDEILRPAVLPSLSMTSQGQPEDEEILFQKPSLPAMSSGTDVPDSALQRKQFFFDGRWIADEDPLKIGEQNFADIKNYRYRNAGLEGVDGYSKINTTILGTTPGTYYLGRSGIQLLSEYTVGSYILAQAWNAGLTASAIILNRTAVPGTGNFEATLVHEDASGSGLGRFSRWPDGHVAYCNGMESMVWAGDEMPVAALITSTADIGDAVTQAVDYTDAVRNTLTTPGNVAIVGGENDADVKLLLHCNGIATPTVIPDTSGGGDGGATHGNATVVGAGIFLYAGTKKFGDACLYGPGPSGGGNNYIYFDDHADWNFGSGDFTIDCWLYPNTTGTKVIMKQRAASDDFWHICQYSANNNILFYCTHGGLLVSLTGSISLSTHHWHHVAIVRNGTTFSIYVNGVLDVSDTFNITMPDLAEPLEIMGPTEDGIDSFSGCLDELRICKGVARWTGSSFTVPAAAYRESANYFLVGSTRPLQGVKFYLSSVNGESAPALTVKEWNGSAWAALSVTDNTSGLTTNGTVTWASTVDSSKPKYLEGRLLYWYRFYLDAGSAELYQVTVDAPFQTVRDIWDGVFRVAASFRWNNSGVDYDKTLDVAAQTPAGVAAAYSYTADLGALDASDAVYIGFEERICGIRILMFEAESGQVNTNAAALSVYYWDGNDWADVAGKVDGTLDSGATKTLTKSGVVSWTAPEPGQEFQRDMNNLQLYYYKIVPTAALSATVRVDVVQGIPAQNAVDVDMAFPFQFQGRAMLAKGNRLTYSATHAPDVWNGEDSSNGSAGEIYVGESEALTGAIQIYNRFGSSIYNTVILTKAAETYLLDGSGPDDWRLYTISTNIGCPAPLTLATAEVGYEMAQDAVRNIAVWLSHAGPVLFDGGTLIHIKKDVGCYFDRSDSRCIEADNIANAIGWLDTLHNEYNLCIPSGAAQYYNNVWLVFDLVRKRWFKKYPGTYAYHPQAVVPVQDAEGNRYVYAFDALGWMLRLEHGTLWASGATAIDQEVTTADQVPSGDIWNYVGIRRLKLLCDAVSEDRDVTISHYKNGESAATTPALSVVAADGANRYVRHTQGVNLRGWSHRWKFAVSTSATAKGVPLLAWGYTYEVVREDH